MKYTPKYKIKSVKFTYNGKDYDVEGSKVLSGIYQYAKGGKLADYTYIPKNRVKEFITKDGSIKKHSNGVWVLSSVLKSAPTKTAKKPAKVGSKTSPKSEVKKGALVPPSVKYKGKKNMPVKAFEVAEEMVAMKKANAKISSIRSKTMLLDIELRENKDMKDWHEPLAYTVLWYNANMPLNLAFEILSGQEYYGEGVIKAYKEEFKKAPDVTGKVSKIKRGGFMSNSAEQKLSKSFVSKDTLRPQMMHTYIDNGYAVSTNAHILLAIYDKTLKGKEEFLTDPKTTSSYPNWRGVVPNTYSTTTKKINAQRLYDFLLKAKKYNAYNPITKGIVIKINDDNNFGFNIDYITQSLKAIMSLGDDVYIHYQDMITNRAIIFTNIENWDLDKENSSFALTMPIMVDRTYSDYISYDLDGDTVFAKGGVTSALSNKLFDNIKDLIKKSEEKNQEPILAILVDTKNSKGNIVEHKSIKFKKNQFSKLNTKLVQLAKSRTYKGEEIVKIEIVAYIGDNEKRLKTLSYAKGGKVSDFDKLANKVAKQYSGKKVPSKYRSEYGKMYSPEEAQEVGRKVAYKVMMMQEGKKMAEGGEIRTMQKGDAVLYNDETWYITEKNGQVGIINFKQGAWGSNYPFIPITRIIQDEQLTDMYGNKVFVPYDFYDANDFAKGGMLWNDIYEKYPSSKYYMSRTQLQDWLPAKLTILEKTGEKTSSGRDIYKDNPVKTYVEKDRLWFEEYAKGGRTISIVNDGVKFDKSKYKAVYGDFDKDGTVNIDDANPLDATKNSKVEQVELKDTFDKLLSVKAELDDIMYDAVDTLDKKAPKDADIYARTKTPYSILKKLVEKRMLDPNKGLTDMIGTTIAVGNQKELEQVRDDIDGGLLGKVLDRDDYYKNPKAGYRAYHYIVEYDGVPVEVQLKTKRMKKLNEVSHDFYKKGMLDAKGLDAVSKTFEKADRGDKKALAEVNKLLSDKKALASKISTSKMAKGGKVIIGDKMPYKYIGNDDIVYLKTKEDSKGANYNLYYKGHDIDVGGYRFGSKKQLEDFANNYILSNQLYRKLRNVDSKPLPSFAKGGAIKELRREKDIDIYEDVMEMGGDVTDSQDLTIANSDNLVMKKGGKTKKRKTGTKKPNSFFAVVKRNQRKGEAWKDAIQRVKREMAKK